MTEKPREPYDPTDMSNPLYDSARDPMPPFYEGKDVDSERRSDSPADDTYKVGPGFPPKEYTWKKGGQSPNPKGRPKKTPSMKPDVKKAFEDAIFEKVEVKKGDKKVWMTKINVGLQQLATQFAKGDRHARRDVLEYASQLGVDLQAKNVFAEALGVDEQAIVDAAFRRRQQQAAPEVSPDDHVKAPPDLLDDDTVKTASDENPDSVPQREAKKPPEPILDEHGKALPVSDIRYIWAIRDRNLAEQKKNQEES